MATGQRACLWSGKFSLTVSRLMRIHPASSRPGRSRNGSASSSAPCDLARLPREELPHELGIYLMLAVVGTSRLPITSLESPLPAFSLGQLAYLPSLSGSEETWTDPIAMFRTAVDGGLPVFEQTKALETALRASAR